MRKLHSSAVLPPSSCWRPSRHWPTIPIVIKFSHVVANDTPKGKGSLKFKELAEKYTNGTVKIEVYPTPRSTRTRKRSRRCNSAQCRCWRRRPRSSLRSASRNSKRSTCPGCSRTTTPIRRHEGRRSASGCSRSSRRRASPGLAYWDNGFHMMSANRPLLKATDFEGLRSAFPASKIADQIFPRPGSIPQIMAFSEVYQALQTGVVDGCENTASNYLTQKFYEVQKDITVSYHAHLQYAVIVNTKFWNGLPADIRWPARESHERGDRLHQLDRAPRRTRTRLPRSRSRARPPCIT